MRKLIILLLCCMALVSMVGCGGNTASPPTERPPTTVSETVTTKKPTEETKNFETPNASKEKENSQTIETTSSIASQHTESVITVTKPAEEIPPEPETTPSEIDTHYWILFAKEYAVSIGLTLDSTAVDCWDNPIRAGAHCIYIERDIQNRLNRYAKDEDITDVWIWVEHSGDDCYDIYIGYA